MRRILAEKELTQEGLVRGSGAKGKRRSVTVNLAESPLSWLHARGHIDERLFVAGERLRDDYERAQLGANVTMRWDPVRVKTTGEQGLTATERQIAAKDRFDGALREAGSGLQDILWRVVCAGKACLTQKSSSVGLHEAVSWSSSWRSTVWRIFIGCGKVGFIGPGQCSKCSIVLELTPQPSPQSPASALRLRPFPPGHSPNPC